MTLNNVVVTALSRGDQAVELAANDPSSGTLNFYLFVFQQACNDTCSALDLLSERIEQDWIGWTLYGQQDLDDTPLGCLSCHQPGGPLTPARLLMRDLRDPWFRWFVPAGMDADCPNGERPINTLPDLRAMFSAAHAAESRYGGITLDALQHADGHILFALLGIYARLQNETTLQEPFAMDTQGTLTEWSCHAKTDLWRQYQAPQRRKGLPVPYYGFDKLDAKEAAAALEN